MKNVTMSSKAVVFDSPVRVPARGQGSRSGWEMGIRYSAAYACTLIAVAAAQLVVPTSMVLLLAYITVAGLPLSLWLRRARRVGRLRIAGRPFPRPWINGGVMLATVAVCAHVLGPSVPLEAARLFDLSMATQTVKLLMQAFLIFGVCRCLAILNDKDAVLCTVPSFSVLLLLIVIHKGTEVVAFFSLWAIAASVLLSLDFRSDVRHSCSATVAALSPKQELKLSARGLAIVLGFSLSATALLSYGVAQDEGSGPDENWISNLTSRLNGFAQDTSAASGNGGPERQIDYSTLPSTPLRTRLWAIKTQRTDNWQDVRPLYWRLFTLSQYDGHSWSQLGGQGRVVKLGLLNQTRWPLDSVTLEGVSSDRAPLDGSSLDGPTLNSQPRRAFDIERTGVPESRALYFGAAQKPTSTSDAASGAGVGAVRLRQYILALSSNTGFVPILPGATAIRFQGSQLPVVHERGDASLDVGLMQHGTDTRVQSDVAPLEEFGFSKGTRPLSTRPPSRLIAHPRLVLSPQDERLYLQLPRTLPARVRAWARRKLRGALPDESNFERASRLARALQEGAFYTLRPPLVPPDRDATDFFLFDSRRGYCTHFAGSLAATCRTVGIPSRIVSGFTNAEWSQQYPGFAELRESGSHAWVEIWEPGWGWALVDPTPRESRGNNASSLLQSWEDMRGILGEFLVKHFASLPLAWPLLGSALALTLLVLSTRARLWRALRAPEPGAASREATLARETISALFQRAARTMSRRFRPRAPWETPGEWLQAALPTLNLSDEAPLRELFELYALARFSPYPLDITQARQAQQALQRLKWTRKSRPQTKPRAAAPKEAAPVGEA